MNRFDPERTRVQAAAMVEQAAQEARAMREHVHDGHHLFSRIDMPVPEPRQSSLMSVSRVARGLVFVVAAALGWSAWTTCADAIATAAQQMACCKDGQFTCGPSGSASDCCKTNTAHHGDSLSVAKTEHVHPPVVLSTAARTPLVRLPNSVTRAPSSASPPHLDAGPPPYIAFSSLLI